MSKRKQNLTIAWVPFQRRVQSLAQAFDLKVCYQHVGWGERGRLFRAFAWLVKGWMTLKDLIRHQPDVVFIQLAPTPLLYVTALYCFFTKCRYVSDCHNTMLYDAHNIHWPLAKFLLRRSAVVIVHNDDVQFHADKANIPSVILRDPLPIMAVSEEITSISGIHIKEESYIIVPGSMAEDEPLEELFNAAKATPESLFVMTWFAARLPQELQAQVPENIRFTGFLDEPEFNALYANANAAIVLTTREGTQPSGASEAISLGIPLVVSEIATTRRLYQDHPVYVNNQSASIAEGVKTALSDYNHWSAKIIALRNDLEKEANQQIEQVKEIISFEDYQQHLST